MVSVITPALDVRFINRCYQSLVAQNCEWEWLIQIDAKLIPPISNKILNDKRVKVEASGRHCGTPACRNLALSRSSGGVIQMLDIDDELLPNALVKLSNACLQDGIGFATMGFVNKYEDGREVEIKTLPSGRIGLDAIHVYEATNLQFPVPAAMTCYRREALIQAGGFSAWTHGDDVITLKRINHSHYGWHIDEALAVYHHYDGQTTSIDGILPLRTLRRDFEGEMVKLWGSYTLPHIDWKN